MFIEIFENLTSWEIQQGGMFDFKIQCELRSDDDNWVGDLIFTITKEEAKKLMEILEKALKEK